MRHTVDTTKYIEIPYKNKGRDFDGTDCWGLIRLLYINEYNTTLLSMDNKYENAAHGDKVKDVIRYGKDVVKYIKKEFPDYGDLIVFNMRGNPCHVGMYIGNNKVLHILKGTNSVCERLSSFRLKGKVEGYYEITEQQDRGASL